MSRRLHPRPGWLWLAALLIFGGTLAGLWGLYAQTGRTPVELLDHAERRLQGHEKLAWLASPLLDGMRRVLHAPRVGEREQAFQVPPPPARRGASDVAAPGQVLPGATVWRVGPGEPLVHIADAARRARDGDVVEIVAGDYRGDVATWTQKRLTIRGVGGAARLFADGRAAEGKAIWVVRDGEFDISNIDFIGAAVSDGNGAGIRFERGHLRLRHCLFWGNQMGLVTANADHAGESTLSIESSEFAYSQVRDRWGHNLYVGSIASLAVVGSYFHHADVGHLLKSRARINDVRYSRFTDEAGGRASYELDFPNGGQVTLVGNIVQQQRGTENGKLISYGEEGYAWPVNSLRMASNTFVNDHPQGGSFVHVAHGADAVLSVNNLRVGRGRDQIHAPLRTANDHTADAGDFMQANNFDYRLRGPAPSLRYQPVPDAQAQGLTPTARYVHPLRVEPLSAGPQYVGAEPRGS